MKLNKIVNKSTRKGSFRFQTTKSEYALKFSVKVSVLFSAIKCSDYHRKQTIANETKQFKVITFSAISVYKTFFKVKAEKILKYLINHWPTPKTFTSAHLYYLL